jgi:hypothetical protein
MKIVQISNRNLDKDVSDDWPLLIHNSFWKDWAFVKWQALRRNPRYQAETTKLHRAAPELLSK